MLSFLNLDSLAGKAVQAAMTLQASIEKTIQETQSEFEAEVRKNELRKEEEQKKPKVTPGEVCPLWTVFAEKQSILEGELQKRVLELSEKEELFVTPSPASDTFDFDLTSSLPFALRALQEDPRLEKMRFKLVPKRVSEQKFFQRYFCAVQKARADIGVDAFPFSVSAATIRPATTHASSDDSIARLEHALAGDGSELDTDADLDHANGAKTPGDVSDIEADLAAVLAQPTIPSTPPSVQRTPSKFSMSAATPATPQSPTVVFSSTSLPPTPQSAAPSTNKPVASPVAQSPAPSASTNSLTGLPIDHHVDLTDDTLESLLADVTLGGNNIEMSKELEDELNASLEEITGESL